MFESDVEFYDENTNISDGSFLEAEAFKNSPNTKSQPIETPESSCDTCFFATDKVDLDSLFKDLEDIDCNFRSSCNGPLAWIININEENFLIYLNFWNISLFLVKNLLWFGLRKNCLVGAF